MVLFKRLSTVLLRSVALARPAVSVSGTSCRLYSSEALSENELQVAESVLASMSTDSLSVQVIEPDPVVLRKRRWTRFSRRTGVLATKLGMTQLWLKDGTSQAVTVLQVVDNEVVNVRTRKREGYYGLQVGAINHDKVKNISKPVLGQYMRSKVIPKRVLQEFRVTHDALLPVGTSLNAAHFTAGQYVDVCGISIGKGFQGVMKRHGMKGQPASHGVTKTHRKMGATGGGQDPGRVWPGKKMAGRMGGKRVTTMCLKIYRINHQYNVLYVHGPVPGHVNGVVRVTDARRKTPPYAAPFPGYVPANDDVIECEEVYSDDIHLPHEPNVVFPDKRKK